MHPTNRLHLVRSATEQLLLALQSERHEASELIALYRERRLLSPPLAPATVRWQKYAIARVEAVADPARPVDGPWREESLELYRRYPSPSA